MGERGGWKSEVSWLVLWDENEGEYAELFLSLLLVTFFLRALRPLPFAHELISLYVMPARPFSLHWRPSLPLAPFRRILRS